LSETKTNVMKDKTSEKH